VKWARSEATGPRADAHRPGAAHSPQGVRGRRISRPHARSEHRPGRRRRLAQRADAWDLSPGSVRQCGQGPRRKSAWAAHGVRHVQHSARGRHATTFARRSTQDRPLSWHDTRAGRGMERASDAGVPRVRHAAARPAGRDETCPVSTEGGTRRVQLVREGGGGGRREEWLRPPSPCGVFGGHFGLSEGVSAAYGVRPRWGRGEGSRRGPRASVAGFGRRRTRGAWPHERPRSRPSPREPAPPRVSRPWPASAQMGPQLSNPQPSRRRWGGVLGVCRWSYLGA